MRNFTNIFSNTQTSNIKLSSTFKLLPSAIGHLLYPGICAGCGSDIVSKGNLLCLHCITNLPHTGFGYACDNPVEKIFWGRLTLVSAMSEFYFAKGTIMQHLIHEFKYKGNTDIGTFLGEMMGRSIVESNRFQIDGLVPMPLYAGKEHKRGFNQAAILCKGIAAVIKRPVIINNVIRKRYTETQTKKHRAERWQNVEESFVIKNETELRHKHILLVDDVITTGATLEACGKELLQVDGVSLSIATLAYASK